MNDWLATDAFAITRELDLESDDTVCRAKVTNTTRRVEPSNRRPGSQPPVCARPRRLLRRQAPPRGRSHPRNRVVADVSHSRARELEGPASRRSSDLSARARRRPPRGPPQDALNFVESRQPLCWGADGYQFHELWTSARPEPDRQTSEADPDYGLARPPCDHGSRWCAAANLLEARQGACQGRRRSRNLLRSCSRGNGLLRARRRDRRGRRAR